MLLGAGRATTTKITKQILEPPGHSEGGGWIGLGRGVMSLAQ